MKRIILDYYRRWWPVILALLVAHILLESWSLRSSSWQRSILPLFSCNIFLFLGIMITGDFARGQARVLAFLPLTPRQSGRALWIASILIPGLIFAIATLFCALAYSNGRFLAVFESAQLRHWASIPIVVGSIFASQAIAQIIVSAVQPTSTLGIAGMVGGYMGGVGLALGGWFYLQGQSIHPLAAAFTIILLAVITALGWLRAGELITFQATRSRSFTSAPTKKAATKTVSGVGGLRFLLQRTFLRSVLFPLGIYFLIHSFNGGSMQSFNLGGNVYVLYAVLMPMLFVLMMEIVPVAEQLRSLRTLPISSSMLAGILTFLPLVSLSAVATILYFFIAPAGGYTALLPFIKVFLTLAATAAFSQTILVWRGFDTLGYLFLIAPIAAVFYFAFKTNREIPLAISITLPIVLTTLSYLVTRWLVTRSSVAYRIRPGTLNWALSRPS